MRRRNRPSTSVTRPAVYSQPTFEIVRPRVRPLLDLRVIEDRRTWHPMREFRPALTFSRLDQRRIIEKSRSVARESRDPFPSLKLGFAVPQRVALCVRRKQRREAIFAFNKQGKGSRSRNRRRTEKTRQQC